MDEELQAVYEAVLATLRDERKRADDATVDAEHWKAEAGRLYARLCLYEDVDPPQQKGLQ